MTEATTAVPEIKLSYELATATVPVFSWITRAETPKGGSARGTASFWSFVGGMRPSIATLTSLHADGLLKGDAITGEDLIPVPEGVEYPATFTFVQGTGKSAVKMTTRRYHGMWLLDIADDHPLAIPAGVTVAELTKWLTAAIPNVMDAVKAERDAIRAAMERKAAAEQMDAQINSMIAAVVVAKNNGLDVTVQEAMIKTFRDMQAKAEKDAKAQK